MWELIAAAVAMLIPTVKDIIEDPPTEENINERARQIGLNIIRAVSDARAKQEIKES